MQGLGNAGRATKKGCTRQPSITTNWAFMPILIPFNIYLHWQMNVSVRCNDPLNGDIKLYDEIN
ncbi:hypothetical protein PSSHI_27740 [Photobacterium sp. R1]